MGGDTMAPNTEQNMRTRDEQEAELTHYIFRNYTEKDTARRVAIAAILEAEVRGAAEQRRRDAEGHEPVAYLAMDFQSGHVLGVATEMSEDLVDYPSCGEINWRPLYTRPANAAALEARVKVLEIACRHVVWTADRYGLGVVGHNNAVTTAKAALKCDDTTGSDDGGSRDG